MGVVGVKNAWAIDGTAEAAYGTAAATPDKSHPFQGDRPIIKVVSARDMDDAIGVYGRGLDSVAAQAHMEAGYEFMSRPDAVATYAKYAFGTLASGVPAGGYTLHTVTQNDGDVPSFTGFWRDIKSTSGKSERYTGCKIRRLRFFGRKGGPVKFSIDIIGSGVRTEETVTMPALNTANSYFTFSDIITFTIGGVDYKARLQEFEIVFENEFDLDNEHAAGATTLSELTRTGFLCKGSFKFKHDENGLAGLIQDVTDQTERAISMVISRSTPDITFTIRRAVFDDASVGGGRGKLVKPITFESLYSTADSEVARMLITSGTDTYT